MSEDQLESKAECDMILVLTVRLCNLTHRSRQTQFLSVNFFNIFGTPMGEVFRIIPEFRILRLTFHKSASKS